MAPTTALLTDEEQQTIKAVLPAIRRTSPDAARILNRLMRAIASGKVADASLYASVTEVARGAGAGGGSALPSGAVQSRNDYGSTGYGGAAPPQGDRPHRYYVVVHALDAEKLGPGADATPAVVNFNAFFHVLARATICPVFSH